MTDKLNFRPTPDFESAPPAPGPLALFRGAYEPRTFHGPLGDQFTLQFYSASMAILALNYLGRAAANGAYPYPAPDILYATDNLEGVTYLDFGSNGPTSKEAQVKAGGLLACAELWYTPPSE